RRVEFTGRFPWFSTRSTTASLALPASRSSSPLWSTGPRGSRRTAVRSSLPGTASVSWVCVRPPPLPCRVPPTTTGGWCARLAVRHDHLATSSRAQELHGASSAPCAAAEKSSVVVELGRRRAGRLGEVVPAAQAHRVHGVRPGGKARRRGG